MKKKLLKVNYDLKKAWNERSSLSGGYGNKTSLATYGEVDISLVYVTQGEYFKIVASDKNICLAEETVYSLNELKSHYKNFIKELKRGNL
jgi:hypothetical protein